MYFGIFNYLHIALRWSAKTVASRESINIWLRWSQSITVLALEPHPTCYSQLSLWCDKQS